MEQKNKIFGLERKELPFMVKSNFLKSSVKDVDTNKRIVTGFYNSYNFFDSDGDILINGSASKSIEQRGVNSTSVVKIKHALNHDLSQLPGKIIHLSEKTVNGITGIYFETKMADTTLGNDTLINYLEGIYDNHSIGFKYLQYEYIEEKSDNWTKLMDSLVNPKEASEVGFAWIIKEIKLHEGSTVAFGANQLTPFLGAKSKNPEVLRLQVFDRITKLQTALKTGKQSDETMAGFDLQLLQLKQIFIELTVKEPPKKCTPQEPPKKSTQISSYSKLLTNLNSKL